MSALARYFNLLGKDISGSDKEPSATICALKKEGINNIWTPHSDQELSKINPDYIIYSTAVNETNPEIKWAKENNKIILHRSELLELATKEKKLIAVSGTHGKTSTTALIYDTLEKNDYSPSCIIGGILNSKRSNSVLGTGKYFVIEADESDKSFLKGTPEIGIITNIEKDHLENYNDGFEEIKKSFRTFAFNAFHNKGLVVCIEDTVTRELISNDFNKEDPKIITYGFKDSKYNPTLSAKYKTENNTWDIFFKNIFAVNLKLQFAGKHYLLNALAAFGAGYLLGLSPDKIKSGIETSKGVQRRFQILGKYNGATIVDDYAHHPTEIKATVDAALYLTPKRLLVLIQPHQPTRLMQLWNEFITVLKERDEDIYITDTYIARGSEIQGINSKKLVSEISKPNVNYLPGNIDKITEEVKKLIKPDDLVLILGAGDITKVGQKLVNSYEILATNSGNN